MPCVYVYKSEWSADRVPGLIDFKSGELAKHGLTGAKLKTGHLQLINADSDEVKNRGTFYTLNFLSSFLNGCPLEFHTASCVVYFLAKIFNFTFLGFFRSS